MLRPFVFGIVTLAMVAGGPAPSGAFGAEFRILTKIYVGTETSPACENLTLFRDGLVYDFATLPDEIAVYHPVRERFVLLNPDKKLRTEITLPQLAGRFAVLQSEMLSKSAADREDESLSDFLAAPKYDVQAPQDKKVKATRFVSRWMEYALETIPARTPAAAKQYADFTHWYTRLNSLRNPAMLARLPINQWLTEGQRVPEKIELTTFTQGPFGMKALHRYRSEHNVAWALSVQDRQKIEEVDEWLASYREVDYDEYTTAKATP